jgi:tight adherence protein B
MSPTLVTILTYAFLVILAAGIGAAGILITMSARSDLSERISTYAYIQEREKSPLSGRQRSTLTQLRYRINNMLSIFYSRELNIQLITANWPITQTEYLLIRYAGSALLFFLGWIIFGSILPGIGLAILGYLVPAILLRRSITNRRTAFERQLVDVLVLTSGAVRAGYSLLQALDLVAEEMSPPSSHEFQRVRREVGLGLPLSQALTNLSERMRNDDLDLVVTAININAQVGGNLTTMLAAVTDTIRDRIRLFSEIRVITSQQRYTGYVLTLLPVIVGGLMFVLNPSYMSGLFQPGAVLCIPIGALIGILLGNIVIRRMTRIDV